MQSWDYVGLWHKSKLFMDHAFEHDHKSSEFAFFASLSIECLGRSALTKIHPVLNADPRDDSNILYACGFPFAKPKSLPAHSVFIRLEKLVDGFQNNHRELCDFLALQRNAHIHTADLPYENLATEKWLARFYDTINVIHTHLGIKLSDFIGKEGEVIALELIKTLNAEVLSAVKSKISAHSKVFLSKSGEEQESLVKLAESASIFSNSYQEVCPCPACSSKSIIVGKTYRELPEQYSDGELFMDVEYIAQSFFCKACGLTFSSIEELANAGLPTHFTNTKSTNLHDLYDNDYGVEYDNM